MHIGTSTKSCNLVNNLCTCHNQKDIWTTNEAAAALLVQNLRHHNFTHSAVENPEGQTDKI